MLEQRLQLAHNLGTEFFASDLRDRATLLTYSQDINALTIMDQSTRPQYGIVLVSASSEAEATAIAQALVTEKLAACVSITPITSVYTWENQLHQEPEWQLVIKTDLQGFATLEARIQALHSYAVPEIIALPIQHGSQPYLQWISQHVDIL